MKSREAGRWGVCESVDMGVLGCSAPGELIIEKAAGNGTLMRVYCCSAGRVTSTAERKLALVGF